MKRLLLALIVIAAVWFALQNNISLTPDNKLQIPDLTQREAPSPTETPLRADEIITTNVIEKSLPSVVTIGIKTTRTTPSRIRVNPFDPFGSFERLPEREQELEQNIGSGFIASADGLIITNRHVVSQTDASYEVITNDEKTYVVQKIYRDPLNDLAIIKIDAKNLKPLRMGDSSKLKLGQTAIAIGTPLGEFANTVTTGIVSGLGRGITAGSPFEGYVERLDNVIQTDAAISPGNSGGPLLNSAGQVIGVNTAVSSGGQNIGFAIPSNVILELLTSFDARGGSFDRPYIGVRYTMVDKETAIQNKIVEGAYVNEVIEDSPADQAQLDVGDIITQLDTKEIKGDDEQTLAKMILEHKVGDTIKLTINRDGQELTISLTLEATNQ